jgi:hypothetical protein
MPKKETVLSIEELAAEMINREGSIVVSTDCSEKEIERARRDHRFASLDGIGFVLVKRRKSRKAVRDSKTGQWSPGETAHDDGMVEETV